MASKGKRDFSELSAKLEKHIERLPDYAQKAQETIQRYVPPANQQQGRSSGPQRYDRRPPEPRPPRMPQLPVDIPVVNEVRSKWATWNAPENKLARRKRRTSRALTLWIVLTILCGIYAVATGAGIVGTAAGNMAAALGGIAGVVVFGSLGIRSGLRLRELNRTELPASTTPPPLPSPNSAAREPMERLAESEASLAELLRQLATPTSVGTTAVPEVSVEDARATAKDAASALRGIAGRIQAIERARNTAPPGERAALDTAVGTLREQLDDGLDGYGSLVAAAGKAVAASSGGVQASKEAITDATDRLAGLAIALRELS